LRKLLTKTTTLAKTLFRKDNKLVRLRLANIFKLSLIFENDPGAVFPTLQFLLRAIS
jgi:hypothetical protein